MRRGPGSESQCAGSLKHVSGQTEQLSAGPGPGLAEPSRAASPSRRPDGESWDSNMKQEGICSVGNPSMPSPHPPPSLRAVHHPNMTHYLQAPRIKGKHLSHRVRSRGIRREAPHTDTSSCPSESAAAAARSAVQLPGPCQALPS